VLLVAHDVRAATVTHLAAFRTLTGQRWVLHADPILLVLSLGADQPTLSVPRLLPLGTREQTTPLKLLLPLGALHQALPPDAEEPQGAWVAAASAMLQVTLKGDAEPITVLLSRRAGQRSPLNVQKVFGDRILEILSGG